MKRQEESRKEKEKEGRREAGQEQVERKRVGGREEREKGVRIRRVSEEEKGQRKQLGGQNLLRCKSDGWIEARRNANSERLNSKILRGYNFA